MRTKVGELKGARNLTRIECSCGQTWIRYGNKKLDAKERRAFIKTHKDHDLLSFQVTSKVW